MKNLATYFDLARERYRIKLQRDVKAPPPWTADPILANWRFCNVFREDDAVTRWFRENVREPLNRSMGPGALFATIAFRWFNCIATGEALKESLLKDEWGPKQERLLLARRDAGETIFTGAFIINSEPGKGKLESVLECLRVARTLVQETIRAQDLAPLESLQACHAWLQQVPRLGRFMAYEIVSDLRHTFLLDDAHDILTWASAGPGCARGLSWTWTGDHEELGYGSDKAQVVLNERMQQIVEASRSARFWPQEWPAWEMREAEHWACEVWKYINARDNGGRMKVRYHPR